MNNRLDLKELIKMLQMTDGQLKRYVKKILKKYGYSPILRDGFLYAEGDTPIVLLSHLDTVFGYEPRKLYFRNGGKELHSHNGLGADDRAGIYGIVHLIRKGYKPHILLLEDEEIGCVGARLFNKSDIKLDATYLIELDRRGRNDCVFYDCYNPDFVEYVENFGFKEEYGSCSDISIIAPEHGMCAVNLSVGYYNQHTESEYLVFNELSDTLTKVENMLNNPPTEMFVYESFWDEYERYCNYYKYVNDTDTQQANDYGEVTDKEIDNISQSLSNIRFVHSKVYGRNVKAVPCGNCFLCVGSRDIDYLYGTSDYLIGEDEEIYTYDGKWVQGAELVDNEWSNLFYDDFLFGYTPTEEKLYY